VTTPTVQPDEYQRRHGHLTPEPLGSPHDPPDPLLSHRAGTGKRIDGFRIERDDHATPPSSRVKRASS
jgi:hypothetical protein